MSGQTLQTLTHIDQMMHLLVLLIEFAKLRVHLEGTLQGDIQFIGNHFGDRITYRIRQIHHTADIPDNALGSKRTEGNDLHHFVSTVFSADIINDFLTSVVAEVNIDIGHGYTFRI